MSNLTISQLNEILTPQLISHLQGNPHDEEARITLSERPDRHNHMDPNPEDTNQNL
jgi:hypothetical protein